MKHIAFALLAVLTLTPLSADAALLYAESSGDAYGPGDTFVVTVRLDNEEDCINAGKIVLEYPSDIVKPVDFSRGGSLFTLWISEPNLLTSKGSVVFEGGIPGGYCGRIQGDPSLSNIVGKVVFTVLNNKSSSVSISPSKLSEIYISDGLGTKAALAVNPVSISILPTSVGAENSWVLEVEDDTLPPDSFAVRVESTEGVFNGNYYAVFSTVDKQSGLSHYEILEQGIWRKVESPYKLKDQALEFPVVIRAVDKAGNTIEGVFDKSVVPERKATGTEVLISVIFMVLLAVGGALALFIDKKMRKAPPKA